MRAHVQLQAARADAQTGCSLDDDKMTALGLRHNDERAINRRGHAIDVQSRCLSIAALHDQRAKGRQCGAICPGRTAFDCQCAPVVVAGQAAHLHFADDQSIRQQILRHPQPHQANARIQRKRRRAQQVPAVGGNLRPWRDIQPGSAVANRAVFRPQAKVAGRRVALQQRCLARLVIQIDCIGGCARHLRRWRSARGCRHARHLGGRRDHDDTRNGCRDGTGRLR